MDKPKSLRMRLHEMNRPPEYLQAYPAEEMDDYLCGLEADALSDHLELSGAVSLLKDLKAENARLKEALEGIMAIAGNPNAIAACRLIIKEARAALGKGD